MSLMYAVLGWLGILSSATSNVQANPPEHRYGLMVVGDDALTEGLSRRLQEPVLGFEFVRSDNVGRELMIIRITQNLELTNRNSREYAKFRVRYSMRGEAVGSLNGECPTDELDQCRNAILHKLVELIRK